MNQLCSHHDPLTEGGDGVLIHTHVIPFGQLTVGDENEATCFGQKHNSFIQELEVFFGWSQIKEIIYDDQVATQYYVPVGFLSSGGYDKVFFGAVDRRRSVCDRFLGDPCGKRLCRICNRTPMVRIESIFCFVHAI